ncbi:DNA polymerase III subunit gamma/tau [Maribacter sp. HTCC2170]|uniref:DNA polymerase III subunit gamma/tau n=1 Tax=Maribacter sp. (strain HTCC2170 / KCCM 42371) TaxID=313603 RepID=UPI00006B47C3|nr:DNA polymerase III subunit gamma/tau [Maribacter sp. HTCC2170]
MPYKVLLLEPFIVSARKYRPQTFKDVVGQQAITNTLLNAIEHNHLAQALLFCGPRGVGKTTCARILAKQINQDGTEREDEDFAFNIFELDAASNNSVDDIRNLIDQVRIPPQVGKYKVYIIDEVHMLSQSAFNAFLKTLEEPPKHAIFILATTEKHKIIPTILSRCQIFDFKRITVKDAAEYLKYIAKNQGIVADDDALHIIAQKADGAMRDALSIFDRVVSFSGKNLTRKAVTDNLNVLDYDTYFSATDLILKHNIPSLLLLFNKTLALGFDGHHFISGLASHFRDLMVCKHAETIELLEVGESAKKNYLEQSKQTSNSFLLKALNIANECDLKYKTSKNQRLLVELSLMKLASIDFLAEKKNPESIALANNTVEFIAPASFYRQKPSSEPKITVNTSQKLKIETITQPTPVPLSEKGMAKEEVVSDTLTQVAEPLIDITSQTATQETTITKPISINTPVKRVSGLSISSLKAKKQHEINKIEVVIDENDLPKEALTEEDMQKHWFDFVKKIDNNGQKLLASILNTDTPKLMNESTIWIELPNDTMKKELEREKFHLMEHLRTKLNNHFIKLKITVNEEVAKKFAFTPEEKYQKLREKNPAIDVLRKTFDLDL